MKATPFLLAVVSAVAFSVARAVIHHDTPLQATLEDLLVFTGVWVIQVLIRLALRKA